MSYSHDIYETAVEMFEITCFLYPIEETSEGDPYFKSSDICSVVELKGATEGIVIITPSDHLLHAMAGNMLGIEDPNTKQKEETLCEVANIISGNIAPMFSRDDEICYINPPRLVNGEDNQKYIIEGAKKESVRIFLSEGVADIEVYYQDQEIL